MALSDLFGDLHLFVRWMHVISGITWLGFLYFFNFVNVPLQAVLDDAGKKAVNSKLMPRALWWFRWGAMFTFIWGMVLFTLIYMYTPGVGFGPSAAFLAQGGGISARAHWILSGMLLATIMWFNVWFLIWPAQQKILSGKAEADEVPRLRRRASLASKINTYLSAPMLFAMLAPNHFGAFDAPVWLATVVVGCGLIAHAIMFSRKVGTSV